VTQWVLYPKRSSHPTVAAIDFEARQIVDGVIKPHQSGSAERGTPSPRQLAGRINQRKRRPLTDAGREALRQAVRHNHPWEHATGPRTDSGRARSRRNALKHGERARTLLPEVIQQAVCGEAEPTLETLHEAIAELMRIGTAQALRRAARLSRKYTNRLAEMLADDA
jgi:hypothetical protein